MVINVNVNELINYYPLDTLKCFERPKLILTEYMRTNAMLYRLLFNELLYSDDFDNFIERKTGIRFHKVSEKIENFQYTIENIIDFGVPIMVKIDHLYEPLWENFVPGEHEPHTVIVKGYDKEDYILIDEDYSQDYFGVKNKRIRMDYCERKIKKDKLYLLASNAYQAFPDDSMLDEQHFVYYYPLKMDDRRECMIDEIRVDFQKLIKEILCHLENDINEMEFGIKCAIGNFNSILNSKQIDYNYKYIWLKYDGYAVPKEVFKIFSRATTLKMYQIFFENMGFPDFDNSSCLHKVDITRAHYEKCKNLFRKAVFSKNVNPCRNILLTLHDLYCAEKTLYETFLDMKFD